jgi:hypothetical protein
VVGYRGDAAFTRFAAKTCSQRILLKAQAATNVSVNRHVMKKNVNTKSQNETPTRKNCDFATDFLFKIKTSMRRLWKERLKPRPNGHRRQTQSGMDRSAALDRPR